MTVKDLLNHKMFRLNSGKESTYHFKNSSGYTLFISIYEYKSSKKEIYLAIIYKSNIIGNSKYFIM